MTKQALKLALEALEVCEQSNYGRNWVWPDTAHPTAMANVKEAITAIREALAQPEQEPVACIVKGCINDKSQGRFVGDLCSPCHAFIATGQGNYSQAYRNTQRTWVGLTEEETDHLFNMYERSSFGLVRAVEAKLKEKNT